MSEVEKLFELADVEKSKCWDNCTTCTRTSCDKNISYIKAEYPPFTAEKQLELIKWCLDNYRGEIFDYIETTEWFEEQLCAYINNEWQDLTEKERKQIKDILE